MIFSSELSGAVERMLGERDSLRAQNDALGMRVFSLMAQGEMDKAVRYVVYRFNNDEKVNLNDPSHIVEITTNTFYKLPYENGKTKYRYVVTALDRLHNESKSVSKKIKL